MNELINIQLTNEDAELFRKFREHQDTFSVLIDSGVFDTRNGEAILNLDNMSNLTQIKTNVITYKRKMLNVAIFTAQ